MRGMLWVMVLAGCSGKGGDDGDTADTPTADADADTDTDADSDSDTDTDADSDTDTDADSDPTGDTSAPTDTGPSWSGSYVGTISGAISDQPTPSGPVSLTKCNGAVTIDVDEALAQPISGTGTCITAAGAVFNVTVGGSLAKGATAGGTLVFAPPAMGFSGPWSGGFSVDTLSGTAVGNTGAGFPWRAWDVSFTATR